MTTREIITFTGKLVDPFCLKPKDLDIKDIAHALAHTCRFGGHTPSFYSVAQHSMTLAKKLGQAGEAPEVKMAALLHDAAEAYLGDVVRPLKHLTYLCGSPWEPPVEFKAIEERALGTILRWAGLSSELPLRVVAMDDWLTNEEYEAFWEDGVPVRDQSCLLPGRAEAYYLEYYEELRTAVRARQMTRMARQGALAQAEAAAL